MDNKSKQYLAEAYANLDSRPHNHIIREIILESRISELNVEDN
jgi:hypothetical protein